MNRAVKRLLLFLALVPCFSLAVCQGVQAAPENSVEIKELNFVFLHGMGGNPCTLQLLSDQLLKLFPVYETNYRTKHPNITLRVNMLSRCYPGYVDIQTWAKNITDDINVQFKGRENIILVGHSMGGKTALYAVANNIGGIAERAAAVVTINSPIRSLSGYYVPGGGPMYEYCRTTLLGDDKGVCVSLATHDSSSDGAFVSRTKHWLAFVSSEPAPLSTLYDRTGVDVWPRNMDDGIVPLAAQFSEGADVVYYGEYGHSDVGLKIEPAAFVANQILRYIFGGFVECSVIARGGSLEHEADWLLGTDRWTDIVGGVIAYSGRIERRNSSFYKWREWEDVIGDYIGEDIKAYAQVRLSSSLVFTGVRRVNWLFPEDVSDLRIRLKSRAAPLTSVKVDWAVYKSGLFPPGQERTFYDIEVTEGTPLAGIRYADWLRDEPDDPVFWISSEAQSPFRWFKAEWRIYQKEYRWRSLIDEI